MEKLVYGGDGLARLEGRVVFAPFVLPGERVRVESRQEKPGLVRADTLGVIEPAPQRTAAPCPYFGRCGGCHYQHAPSEYQLELKRGILVEELRRLGKVEPPEEIGVVAGEPWGYRNHIRFSLGRRYGDVGYTYRHTRRLLHRPPLALNPNSFL